MRSSSWSRASSPPSTSTLTTAVSASRTSRRDLIGGLGLDRTVIAQKIQSLTEPAPAHRRLDRPRRTPHPAGGLIMHPAAAGRHADVTVCTLVVNEFTPPWSRPAFTLSSTTGHTARRHHRPTSPHSSAAAHIRSASETRQPCSLHLHQPPARPGSPRCAAPPRYGDPPSPCSDHARRHHVSDGHITHDVLLGLGRERGPLGKTAAGRTTVTGQPASEQAVKVPPIRAAHFHRIAQREQVRPRNSLDERLACRPSDGLEHQTETARAQ